METTIYTLSHPITGEIKYVGRTTAKLKRRLSKHLADAKIHNYSAAKWIQDLVIQGLRPIIESIETLLTDGNSEEIFWISQLRAWGINLLNETIGGIGANGAKRSMESNRKNAANHKKFPVMIDGIRYESIRDAHRRTNIPFATIRVVCNGGFKSSKHNIYFAQ